MGRTMLKSKLCQGPALAGYRGYPQDAQHWRDKTCETSLDRAKSQDEQQERERERERERECPEGVFAAGSGNPLFFTVAFIP